MVRRAVLVGAGVLLCLWIFEILLDYTISPLSSGIWVLTTLAAGTVIWLGVRYFGPSDEFLLQLYSHFSPGEATLRLFLAKTIPWLLIFTTIVAAIFVDLVRTFPR